MEQNEKHLLTIKDEMENVRELYIKGYIDKKTYQLETRTLFDFLFFSLFFFTIENKYLFLKLK